MKEKDRYVVEKMPTYCLFPEALCGLKDTESKFYVVLENIDAVIKIKDLLNQQDKEIAKLQYRLEVAEKALELACKEELREIGIYDDDSDYEKEMSISKQQYIEQAEREVKGVKK